MGSPNTTASVDPTLAGNGGGASETGGANVPGSVAASTVRSPGHVRFSSSTSRSRRSKRSISRSRSVFIARTRPQLRFTATDLRGWRKQTRRELPRFDCGKIPISE